MLAYAFPVQSSRSFAPKYCRDDPLREWCPPGDDGLDEDRPSPFKGLSGSLSPTPFPRLFGLSIVVFS